MLIAVLPVQIRTLRPRFSPSGPSLRELKNKRSKITHTTEGVTDAAVAELSDDADQHGEGPPAKLHLPGPKTAELFSGSASKWDSGEDKA